MKKNSIFTALVAVIALSACDKGTETGGDEPTTSKEVKFTSNIAPMATRVSGSSWASGGTDVVGIFMKPAGVTLDPVTVLRSNAAYTATNSSLAPVSGVQGIQYPESGNVDFIAYYPYADDVIMSVYESDENSGETTKTERFCALWRFDIRDQYNVHEVLYSNNATNKSASSATVPLEFKYSMAKLSVTVTAAAGTTITAGQFVNMSAQVGNMSGMAEYFDLATGKIIPNGDYFTETITMKTTTDKSGTNKATFEALVFPTVAGEPTSKTFTFLIDGQPVTKIVNQSFEAGKNYIMPFELGGSATPDIYYLKGAAQITDRTDVNVPVHQVAL